MRLALFTLLFIARIPEEDQTIVARTIFPATRHANAYELVTRTTVTQRNNILHYVTAFVHLMLHTQRSRAVYENEKKKKGGMTPALYHGSLFIQTKMLKTTSELDVTFIAVKRIPD